MAYRYRKTPKQRGIDGVDEVLRFWLNREPNNKREIDMLRNALALPKMDVAQLQATRILLCRLMVAKNHAAGEFAEWLATGGDDAS